MPHIFTDEFLAGIDAEPAPFEGSLIKRIALSVDGPLAERRNDIEGKMAAYPADQRAELAGRIQSFSDEESLAAQAELDIHELLRTVFNPVAVEPSLEIIGGKTPDFWVEGHAAFEVASTFAREDFVERDLIRVLNAVKSPVKVFGIRVRNAPEGKFPKMAIARKLVQDQMTAYPGEPAMNPFHVRTPEGMDITGYLYRGDPAHPTVGGTLGSHGFGPDDPDYRNAVRENVVRKKYRKYGSLGDHGNAFVLVFQNFNEWLDAEDFEQVLYGEVEYQHDLQSGHFTLIRRSPIYQPGRYRGISAALLRDPAAPNTYFLAENPYATVPLGAIADRVARAFSAKPLPRTDWSLRNR